jgi:hypothetical protein
MTNRELPTDEVVVATLDALGQTTARKLCDALVALGYSLRQSQLAIQRAAERNRLEVHADWTLSVVAQRVAA